MLQLLRRAIIKQRLGVWKTGKQAIGLGVNDIRVVQRGTLENKRYRH